MPTVPGPRESDRMLIIEKAPLMMPKPSPATANKTFWPLQTRSLLREEHENKSTELTVSHLTHWNRWTLIFTNGCQTLFGFSNEATSLKQKQVMLVYIYIFEYESHEYESHFIMFNKNESLKYCDVWWRNTWAVCSRQSETPPGVKLKRKLQKWEEISWASHHLRYWPSQLWTTQEMTITGTATRRTP